VTGKGNRTGRLSAGKKTGKRGTKETLPDQKTETEAAGPAPKKKKINV